MVGNTACRILLLEEEAGLRRRIRSALEEINHQVFPAASREAVQDLLDTMVFQLVIADMGRFDQEDIGLLEHMRNLLPQTPIILITSHACLQTALTALRQGVFEYHSKPLNLEHLLLSVTRALDRASLEQAYDYLRHREPFIYRFQDIVAQSPAMRRVLDQLARLAPSEATVLLTGETGTGKSLLAGAIHANSLRRQGTLVTVNCAALPETLLESELFGHERGAFTGAHKTRVGRFQAAHGGTLFLDEIGEMSPAIQAKVLRAIDEKKIERLGGSRTIHVDVRILAATNLDLEAAMRQGRFRQDLFYRLNVAPIRVPPLRERREDILPLAQLFLRTIPAELGRPAKRLSPATREAMLDHPWSGNIRELRNAVERGVLLAGGEEITPRDMGLDQEPPPAAGSREPPFLDLARLERWAIEVALEKCDYVQRRAAKLLGISPRVLSYKLSKLDLDRPPSHPRPHRPAAGEKS